MTTPQVESLRSYVERREHADHDTFAMGRAFAELLLETIDDLADQNYMLWNAGQRVCNDVSEAIPGLSAVLHACRPPRTQGWPLGGDGLPDEPEFHDE